MTPDWVARFWSKVDLNGPVPEHRPDLGPCHIWTAALTQGYGAFSLDGRMRRAHRVAFELAGETIPDGLEPDHLCRVHACVRRSHLEAVTRRVNFLRGDHRSAVTVRTGRCRNGHALTPDNIKLDGHGRRTCRACHNARRRRYRAASKVAAP